MDDFIVLMNEDVVFDTERKFPPSLRAEDCASGENKWGEEFSRKHHPGEKKLYFRAVFPKLFFWGPIF